MRAVTDISGLPGELNRDQRPDGGTQLNEGQGTIPTQEERLQLLRTNSVPMWVLDREKLDILEVNQAAIHQYGYMRQEFLYLTVLHMRPLEEIPRLLREALHPALAGPSKDEIWTHRRKDGRTFQVSISSEWVTWNNRPPELVSAKPILP